MNRMKICALIFLGCILTLIIISPKINLDKLKIRNLAQIYSSQYYKEESKKSVTLFSKGEEVIKVKNRLQELGYLSENDQSDYFYLDTFWALRRFQRDNGIQISGVLNEETKNILFNVKESGFIEGYFSMVHADPIEAFSLDGTTVNKSLKSDDRYYVITADKKHYELYLINDSAIDIVPGTKIKVPENFTRDGKISLSNIEDIEVTEKYPYRSYSHKIQETRKNRGGGSSFEFEPEKWDKQPVEYRMLVIPVQVVGVENNKIPSTENIYSRIFGGPINDFFKKNSYNKMIFTGDVAEFVTTSSSCESFALEPFSYDDLFSLEEISAQGYDLGLYLFFNCSSIGSNYAGVGFNGFSGSSTPTPFAAVMTGGYFSNEHRWWGVIDEPIDLPLTNWTFFDHTLAHELGHVLGLYHSKSFENCPSINTVPSGCHINEYGNRYDSMGQGLFSTHFNVWSKFLLGFVSIDEIEEVGTSGQYQLYSNELNSGGTKILKIRHPLLSNTNTRYIVVEKRNPVNFDNLTINGLLWDNSNSAFGYMNNGLFIYLVEDPDTAYYNRPAVLLNLNNTGYPPDLGFDEPYDQKPLMPGENITLNDLGVEIENISSSNNEATVGISFTPPNPEACEIAIHMIDGYSSGIGNFFNNNGTFYQTFPGPETMFLYEEESEQTLYYGLISSLKNKNKFGVTVNSLINCSEREIIFENNFLDESGIFSSVANFPISGMVNYSSPASYVQEIDNQQTIGAILADGVHNFYFKAYDADTGEVYFYKDFHINLCAQETGCSEQSSLDDGL